MLEQGVNLSIKNNKGLCAPRCLDRQFSTSSTAIALANQSNLTASCRAENGEWKPSTIDLDSCLGTQSGEMHLGAGWQIFCFCKKHKPYSRRSDFTGGIRDSNGCWKQAYVWLDEMITNDEGVLKFLGADWEDLSKEGSQIASIDESVLT